MRRLPYIDKLPLLIVALVLLISCSQKKGETSVTLPGPAAVNLAQYKDWEVFRYHKIQIIHPKDHLQSGTFPQLADWYEKHIPGMCSFLGLPPFEDTLRVYYHTGYGQGTEFTGREYPFATKDAIFFWLPSTYGPTLMEFFLWRWSDHEPKHKLLKEGLKSLFDFSGKNYFAVVRYYQNADSNWTLRQLIADPYIKSDSERYQSAYAATFVNFLMYDYGSEKLKALYRADHDFESDLRAVTGLSVDSAQVLWQKFIIESYPDAVVDPEKYKKEVTIPLH